MTLLNMLTKYPSRRVSMAGKLMEMTMWLTGPWRTNGTRARYGHDKRVADWSILFQASGGPGQCETRTLAAIVAWPLFILRTARGWGLGEAGPRSCVHPFLAT